jgi:hypothetical protein
MRKKKIDDPWAPKVKAVDVGQHGSTNAPAAKPTSAQRGRWLQEVWDRKEGTKTRPNF